MPRQSRRVARLKNYTFLRDRREDELDWVRPTHFKGLDLPRPIGLINGCFDVLHSGHMRMIFQAREHCKTLVCAMDSDRLIKEQKHIDSQGIQRPVLSWVERATALGYMPIDYLVEIDNTKEMNTLIQHLDPDFRVQGVEYKTKPTRYPYLHKLFVRSAGMRTSEIIRRIQANDQTRINLQPLDSDSDI